MEAGIVGDLYRREARALQCRLARKMGSAAAAEDVVHDAYLKMLTQSFGDAPLRCPQAFLFTIASNLAVDVLRRENRLASVEDEDGWQFVYDIDSSAFVNRSRPVEDDVDYRMRLEAVIEKLQELPPNCSRAFTLHKFYEHSYAEVARMLGVSVSMVEKHIARALAHLRQYPALFVN